MMIDENYSCPKHRWLTSEINKSPNLSNDGEFYRVNRNPEKEKSTEPLSAVGESSRSSWYTQLFNSSIYRLLGDHRINTSRALDVNWS